MSYSEGQARPPALRRATGQFLSTREARYPADGQADLGFRRLPRAWLRGAARLHEASQIEVIIRGDFWVAKPCRAGRATQSSARGERREPVKPCWLTEWAFPNGDPSCPIHDETRVKLFQTEREALKTFVNQGRLAAIIYYNWTALPGFEAQAIFRCGALTNAGKLALSPM
jgi:hypothetical protein